jgi:hypothetical protein
MYQIRKQCFMSASEFADVNHDRWYGATSSDALETMRTHYPGIERFRMLPDGFEFDGTVLTKDYRIPLAGDAEFYQSASEAHSRSKKVHRKAYQHVTANIPCLRRDKLSRALLASNPQIWDTVDLSTYKGEYMDCGELTEDTPEVFEVRPLKLTFLDIENVGGTPALNLCYFAKSIQPSAPDGLKLRTPAESQRELASLTASKNSFPYGMLRPGEHILIALNVGLGGIGDAETDSRTAKEQSSAGARDNGFYYDLSHPLTPNAEPYRRTYQFGPATQVTKIAYTDVSEKHYSEPIRDLSTQRIQISSVVASGSCPFVFAFDSQSQQWVNTGSVLVGHHSQDDIGHDIRPIHAKYTGLQLRELEPEVSYIDRVWLELTTHSGEVQSIYPTDLRLRSADENYLVMKQGDVQDLQFGAHPDATSLRTLHIIGFYIPSRGAFESRTDRSNLQKPRRSGRNKREAGTVRSRISHPNLTFPGGPP